MIARVAFRCPACGEIRMMTLGQINKARNSKKRKAWPPTCSKKCGAVEREKRRRAGVYAAALIALAMFTTPAHAKLFHFSVTAPCYNMDAPSKEFPTVPACFDTVGASRCTDLDAIILFGRRCGQTDSTIIGEISARGRECDSLSFDMEIEFPADTLGRTAYIWARARDISGNLSCDPGVGVTINVEKTEPGVTISAVRWKP
jgi:hypothetical protein